MPRNVILTGIPRSGTTLTCYLLNILPDHVALHEPIAGEVFTRLTQSAQVAQAAEEFFASARHSLLERGVAPSRHVDGRIPDSHVPERAGPGGLRDDPASWGEVAIGKPLSGQFSLFVKHPVPFTAALSAMTDRFPCYALVRNPLAVLGSWNSVNMYFRTGRVVAAERLDRKFARQQERTKDPLLRQIQLLNWFYERYLQYLPRTSVLRYEEIVATNGAALKVVSPAAGGLNEPLSTKNTSAAYPKKDLIPLAEKLLNTRGACWEFYARAEVEALLAEWRQEVQQG